MGLALVVVLAGLVGLVAANAPSPARSPALAPLSSSGPPCRDPSGICTAPDDCPVGTRQFSAAELERIRPDVESMVQNAFYGIGTGPHHIEMDLYPGHERLAAEVERRFGAAVTIRIGTTRYCGPGRSARCADLQGATALPGGLNLALTLDHGTVQGTEPEVKGTLHVRFDGPGTFTFERGGQPIVAPLVIRGTRTVVSTHTGGLRGTGLGLSLAAGEERSIPVIVGLARCDGGLGSALPSGTYGVRAALGPDGGPPLYLAPEVELTVR